MRKSKYDEAIPSNQINENDKQSDSIGEAVPS